MICMTKFNEFIYNLILQDEESYVRKTAAICVAKLYDISPELIED